LISVITMYLDQFLFEFETGLIEKIQKEILESSIAQAVSDGFEITLIGLYKESRDADPEVKRPIPFVVAQTPEQKAKIENGVLEGRIYDTGSYALIERRFINSELVHFVKRYQLLDSGEIVNPNPIKYMGFGHYSGRYRGSWNLTTKFGEGEMKTNGNFTMMRIDSFTGS
jgi:hypothetical protein